MAAFCSSISLFSLSRPPNSLSRTHPDRPFGLSFRAERRLRARKPAGPLRVSCLADTKVITGKSWDEHISESDTPVLVEFYASWCGPCRMVHRIIEEIATDYSGKLKCFVLDAGNDPKVAENYDVKAVPVVFLFKNGEKCESIIGTMPKEFYVAAIDRVLAL